MPIYWYVNCLDNFMGLMFGHANHAKERYTGLFKAV